jgi:hypothetical protein
MKKFLVLLFSLPFVLVSCGEDDKDFVEQNYLVGNWEIVQIGATSPQGVILYEDYINDSDCKDNYIFNADFTFENNDYTTDGACVSNTIEGNYSRFSTLVTLNYTAIVGGTPQEQEQTLTVVSLTYTEAVMAYTNASGNVVYLKLQKV